MNPKITIIGGGIAGLCTAYHLAESSQAEITLIDKNNFGMETSIKAAGMLTPASEVHLEEEKFKDLYIESLNYYPEFIKNLVNNCKNKIDYKQNGCLLVGLTEDGQKDLTHQKIFLDKLGFQYEEMNQIEIQKKEPLINPQIQYGIWINDEGYIKPESLILILIEKLKYLGVTLIDNQEVSEIEVEGDRISKIKLNHNQEVTSDVYALCTGNNIPNIPIDIPIRSIKGQALSIDLKEYKISSPIRAHFRYPIYLVPYHDGKLIIGATSEEKSDQEITAGGLLDLIYAAWQILPIVYEQPVMSTWSGLRPTSPDHQPIIGSSPLKNLFLNLGLYRHGILISPYIGREMAKLILNQQTSIDWDKFSINRF